MPSRTKRTFASNIDVNAPMSADIEDRRSNTDYLPKGVISQVSPTPARAGESDEAYMRRASEHQISRSGNQLDRIMTGPAVYGYTHDQNDKETRSMPSFKHGGIVKRTGPALLHKGETVIPATAQKTLGGMGKKLHTHEMHIRHADNGGYIVKHDLRDKHGNPPVDGQRSSMETQHPDAESLHEAIDQHMQQNAQGQPGGDDEEAEGED